ncbi:peptidase C48, SUMO/sentrin/Ubl1 [Tanacetum coccineum]
MPRSECKKIFPSRSNCQEWIASNEKYIQSKAEKEAKRKRKCEEKKSPGRWTRSDETKLLAEKHKRIKKQQADNQQTRKNEDKGKEEVVDVEQESEMNERLEKQKQAETEKKFKNKGKEKVVDVEDESETNERVQKQSFNRVLKGRATVRPLFEAMRGLTPQRKRVVREIGFGNLIDFPIVEIPTKLAFYVVDILNTRKMMLECPMGDIVITPKTVKEVLGLPMGRRKLEREGQREYNDPFLEEWKDQFKNINKLTIKALSDLIIDTKNTDYMFRMNILTLIANTLGSCENSSCLKFTVLRNVFEGDDVSDIDWCSYIIECASVSKVDWSKTKKKKDVVYYGMVRKIDMRTRREIKSYNFKARVMCMCLGDNDDYVLASCMDSTIWLLD